eukprot:3038271-Pyramimonas_sp.AAC.1
MALDIQLTGSSWALVSLSSPSATTWASDPFSESVQGLPAAECLGGCPVAAAGLVAQYLSDVLVPRCGGVPCSSSCRGSGLLSSCCAAPCHAAPILRPGVPQACTTVHRLPVRRQHCFLQLAVGGRAIS